MTDKHKPSVEELQKKMDRLYRTAFYYEIVDSKAQFAELIEMTAQNLSSALSGNPRALSENIIYRAERNLQNKLSAKNIVCTDLYSLTPTTGITNTSTNNDLETIENLQNQNKNLSDSVEKLKVENIAYRTEAQLYKDLYQRLLEHLMTINTSQNTNNEHS